MYLMDYADDFISKWGFGDGDRLPCDADTWRSVFVKVFNAMAEKLGKPVRCAAYNRAGMHNYCMVIMFTYDGRPLPGGLDDGDTANVFGFLEAEGNTCTEIYPPEDNDDVQDVFSAMYDLDDTCCLVQTDVCVDELELEELMDGIKNKEGEKQ